MSIVTRLVRKDFGPLDDREVGSPIYDHENRTITFTEGVSGSPAFSNMVSNLMNSTVNPVLNAQTNRPPMVMSPGGYYQTAGSTWDGTNIHARETTVGVGPRSSAETRFWSSSFSNHNPKHMSGYDGPFNTVKYDMGANFTGTTFGRSRSEMASGYQDIWPQHYKDYTSGAINGATLFNRALYDAVTNDRDTILSDYNYTSGLNAAARASITFGKSGRISFSGSFGSGGTSFKY